MELIAPRQQEGAKHITYRPLQNVVGLVCVGGLGNEALEERSNHLAVPLTILPRVQQEDEPVEQPKAFGGTHAGVSLSPCDRR